MNSRQRRVKRRKAKRTLSQTDTQEFVDIMTQPLNPNDDLMESMERYKEMIKEDLNEDSESITTKE